MNPAAEGFLPVVLTELPEAGEVRQVVLGDGRKLCVGRHEEAWFAFLDECPHAGFPMSEGSLSAQGGLECCWHGATFDCRTGAVTRGPAEDPLVRFETQWVDETLWVREGTR